MVVSLPAPEGNKFLFANENKLVLNSWPPSVAKLLGKGSLAVKCGDEHKLVHSFMSHSYNFVKTCYVSTSSHIAPCLFSYHKVCTCLVLRVVLVSVLGMNLVTYLDKIHLFNNVPNTKCKHTVSVQSSHGLCNKNPNFKFHR